MAKEANSITAIFFIVSSNVELAFCAAGAVARPRKITLEHVAQYDPGNIRIGRIGGASAKALVEVAQEHEGTLYAGGQVVVELVADFGIDLRTLVIAILVPAQILGNGKEAGVDIGEGLVGDVGVIADGAADDPHPPVAGVIGDVLVVGGNAR